MNENTDAADVKFPTIDFESDATSVIIYTSPPCRHHPWIARLLDLFDRHYHGKLIGWYDFPVDTPPLKTGESIAMEWSSDGTVRILDLQGDQEEAGEGVRE